MNSFFTLKFSFGQYSNYSIPEQATSEFIQGFSSGELSEKDPFEVMRFKQKGNCSLQKFDSFEEVVNIQHFVDKIGHLNLLLCVSPSLNKGTSQSSTSFIHSFLYKIKESDSMGLFCLEVLVSKHHFQEIGPEVTHEKQYCLAKWGRILQCRKQHPVQIGISDELS